MPSPETWCIRLVGWNVCRVKAGLRIDGVGFGYYICRNIDKDSTALVGYVGNAEVENISSAMVYRIGLTSETVFETDKLNSLLIHSRRTALPN